MVAIHHDTTNAKELDYAKPIEIRTLDKGAPMRWLSKGIDDFKTAPMLSISYGLIYTVLGLLLIWLTYQNPLYTFGMVTIFYLAGPLIAVGLYCMSRQIEAGEKPQFAGSYEALKRNPMGLIGFSITIGIIIVFWTVVAAAISSVFLSGIVVRDTLYQTLIQSNQLVPFVATLMLVGLLFAIVTFTVSIISIPLMTHRKLDVATAIITSCRAVKKNPSVMFTWAFAIVALIALGFATAFVGIAIALPIIGHASWHAYREIVIDE
jgi:uncharacterized membrane protein